MKDVSISSTTTPPPLPPVDAPAILAPTTVQKEIELKNLESWSSLDLDVPTPQKSGMKDSAWSQFKNLDLQNKMRQKEREEQEEREKIEKHHREMERKKEDELRLKQSQQEEEKKKRDEEEKEKQRLEELMAQRALERARREGGTTLDIMGQSKIMSTFHLEMGSSFDVDYTPFNSLKEEGKSVEDLHSLLKTGNAEETNTKD